MDILLKNDELSILIVDDTPANLRILSQVLEGRGYMVRIANSGQRALDAVASNPPDLILLDIMMPEMSGYDVCKQLKSQTATREIPVIFISALASTEDKINAFMAGGVDYVTKPFHFEEVLARVEIHLSIHALQKNLQAEKQKSDSLLLEIIPKLHESEVRYRELFNNANLAIFQNTLDGKIMMVNPEFARLFGFNSPEEVAANIGNAAELYADPKQREELIRLKSEQPDTSAFESHYRRKDGSVFLGRLNVRQVVDARTSQPFFEGFIEDITEHHRTQTHNRLIAEVQDALLRSYKTEDIYKLVSEKVKLLIGDGIAATSILDEKNRTLRMGSYHGVDIPLDKILPVIGFNPWQHEFPLDKMADEDLDIYRSNRLGVLEGGLYALMTRIVPKSACVLLEKLLRVQKIYGMGFMHKEAHLGGLVILARSDITPHIAAIEQIVNLAAIAIERNLAEEGLRNSEYLYRSLFEGVPIALYRTNAERILDVNPAGVDLFGYESREEFMKIPPSDLWVNTEERANAVAIATKQGSVDLVVQMKKRDGSIIWIRNRGRLKQDNHEQIAYEGSLEDVTERKQRENELQAIASVSAALRAAQTRAEMLPIIIEQLGSLLRSNLMVIGMIDPAAQNVVIEAAAGALTPLIGSRLTLDTGMNAILHQTRKPYHDNNIKDDPRIAIPRYMMEDVLAGIGVPLIAQDQVIGSMWMGRSTEIAESEVRLLTAVADIAANAIHRATLHEQTQKDAADLAHAYDITLEGWAHALELRDQETEGHARRVVTMTLNLARAMGIHNGDLENIRRGALLHDIGKMGIPDSILLKTGTLNEYEWDIMRKHPGYAYNLLNPIHYLRPALDIPYCHHEKWDGSGYPRGLKGEQIPLAARIFAIVDVWDALRSDRPYRPAWTKDKILRYINELTGKHFDPAVVEVFFNIVT